MVNTALCSILRVNSALQPEVELLLSSLKELEVCHSQELEQQNRSFQLQVKELQEKVGLQTNDGGGGGAGGTKQKRGSGKPVYHDKIKEAIKIIREAVRNAGDGDNPSVVSSDKLKTKEEVFARLKTCFEGTGRVEKPVREYNMGELARRLEELLKIEGRKQLPYRDIHNLIEEKLKDADCTIPHEVTGRLCYRFACIIQEHNVKKFLNSRIPFSRFKKKLYKLDEALHSFKIQEENEFRKLQ